MYFMRYIAMCYVYNINGIGAVLVAEDDVAGMTTASSSVGSATKGLAILATPLGHGDVPPRHLFVLALREGIHGG